MSHLQKITKFFVSTVSLLMLSSTVSSCSNQEKISLSTPPTTTPSPTSMKSINQPTHTVVSQIDEQIVHSVVIQPQLYILANRCRGCGKCIQRDPEHFALDTTTQKARVLSSENLNSSKLQTAIALCPEQAIVLQ